MKQNFEVPVLFKVKAESLEQAKEFVDRLQRYGFEAISEYERKTWKGIKRWRFVE